MSRAEDRATEQDWLTTYVALIREIEDLELRGKEVPSKLRHDAEAAKRRWFRATHRRREDRLDDEAARGR